MPGVLLHAGEVSRRFFICMRSKKSCIKGGDGIKFLRIHPFSLFDPRFIGKSLGRESFWYILRIDFLKNVYFEGFDPGER